MSNKSKPPGTFWMGHIDVHPFWVKAPTILRQEAFFCGVTSFSLRGRCVFTKAQVVQSTMTTT
eukprot:3099920-Amphidinium_carterae.1